MSAAPRPSIPVPICSPSCYGLDHYERAWTPRPHPTMQPPSRTAEPGAAEILDLLEAARPKLCRLLASLDVPVEDSEDLIHDSLVALLDHWQEIDGVVNPEAWLLGTLRITILQYWRRRQRPRPLPLL